MAEFRQAFAFTMGHEGGYSNNGIDRGGETFRGIARNFHPGWDGWQIIDQYDKTRPGFDHQVNHDPQLGQLVEQFYRREFWHKVRGDEIFSQIIAEELFDTAVNAGVRTAVRYLQDSVNLLNRNGRDYPNIEVDGVFGEGTLLALQNCLREQANERLLYKVMNVLQGAHYADIMRRDGTQENHARGWFGRVNISKV